MKQESTEQIEAGNTNTKTYTVGSRWLHYYGNGYMVGTILRVVDRFRVEFSEYGVVQKSWLNRHWFKLNG